MYQGKQKALTFSFDDGVTQDKRLIALLNKYQLKCTFNLNSELLGKDGMLIRDGARVNHYKIPPDQVHDVYKGHEIAVHTLTHANLTQCSEEEIIRQVDGDRKNLSELAGYPVVGMAYPCGGVNNDDRVAGILRTHGLVRYARTITSTYSFAPQTNLLRFNPTVQMVQEMDKAFELGQKFLDLQPDSPQIFYIWGHSYEFDIADTWDKMEQFCAMMAGHADIFYGTNCDVLCPEG